MQLENLPLLGLQRELYSMPRGMERFRRYLAAMTGGGEDLLLPLTAVNPMGKEHMLPAVDSWIAAGAEEAAAGAVREAAARLVDAPGRLRIGLAIADDVAGGWTNRFTTDFAHRFESAALYRRDFAVGLLWASEAAAGRPRALERRGGGTVASRLRSLRRQAPSPRLAEQARREVLLSLARAAYERRHGPARTLRERLAQEHDALRFAGLEPKPLPPPHFLDAADAPALFACLYGDEAARSLGYSALGVPAAL
jgi:hypothetical protein